MITLSEFLLARIAEDKRQALGAINMSELPSGLYHFGTEPTATSYGLGITGDRLLTECEAKRGLVEQYRQARDDDDQVPAEWNDGYVCGQEFALKLLALPYADHPDYRQEWKP